jgi:hypothetical protein
MVFSFAIGKEGEITISTIDDIQKLHINQSLSISIHTRLATKNILAHLQFVLPNIILQVQMVKIWKPTISI